MATGPIDSGDLLWFDKVAYVIWNTALEALELEQSGRYSLRSIGERLRVASMIKNRLKKLPDAQKNLLIETLLNISSVDIPANLGKEVVLSWDNVREMANNSITFGAHTVAHPILTKLSLEEARREISESKKRIEEELGKPVTSFAYPEGLPSAFNRELKEILKETGFVCAVTTVGQLVSQGADLYELGRIGAGWNVDTLKLCLSGLYQDSVDILKRLRGAS